MTNRTPMIRTSGSSFLGPDGEPLLLRGVCLGGWLNMENFITGYAANETLMRRELRRAIGDDRAERFFERLLTRFFEEPDAAFLGEAGLNLARIAVGYKHFEDDARPLEIKGDGFRHLDRAIEALARHGIYSIVDLHALPGSQNQHWHSDNPTHVAAFWEHRQFQDRVVHLWEAIADHYRGNSWVAGYNLLNEPASAAARTTAERMPSGSSCSAPRTRDLPAVRSSWASSDRSTPGTRLRTYGSAASSQTSSISTGGIRRAGRCGCIRTSAGRVWSQFGRTRRIVAGSMTSWPRRTGSPLTSGAATESVSPR